MAAASLTARDRGRFKQMQLMDSVADRKKRLQVEATLISYEATGNERKYTERPSATTTTATANTLG